MREAEETYKDETEATRKPKVQSIVLHLQRFQNGTAIAGRWEFSHLSEWRQIVVDRLEGEARDVDLGPDGNQDDARIVWVSFERREDALDL